MQLSKGANTVLPPTRGVTVECTWTSRPGLEADLSALLLTAGRVRGDDDFVFYNQPASADRRVFHAGKTAGPDGSVTDRVVVDLVGFDGAVGTVAFAVSLDAGLGCSLADLGPVQATVADGDGTRVAG
ncbi:MAG: TerD family protein, partial [Pseudonocardia sp.]|nr:TerD family protein [Pseudonocardia sp.]